MEPQKIPLKKFLPGIAWFFVVGLLTLLPGSDIPSIGWMDRIKNFDKVVHAGLFGLLTFLFCMPYFKISVPFIRKKNYFVRICLAVIVWGITVELIQKYFIPGRSFDLADWAADSVGSLISLWFCIKITLFINLPNEKR